jgi:hypothetical protein
MIRHQNPPDYPKLESDLSKKADAGIACSSDGKVASGARKIKRRNRF